MGHLGPEIDGYVIFTEPQSRSSIILIMQLSVAVCLVKKEPYIAYLQILVKHYRRCFGMYRQRERERERTLAGKQSCTACPTKRPLIITMMTVNFRIYEHANKYMYIYICIDRLVIHVPQPSFIGRKFLIFFFHRQLTHTHTQIVFLFFFYDSRKIK